MNMREGGPNIYAAGGVLIFGWRKSNIWPANGDTALGQAPQKITNAGLGFQIEGGGELTICWESALAFEVPQDLYHQVLLLRRKLAAHSPDLT